MSARNRADLLMRITFILFNFIGLLLYSETKGQAIYKGEVVDSLIVPYDSDLLQFIDFNSNTNTCVAFDKLNDKILKFDFKGNLLKEVLLEKEGPNGYGSYIEGLSVTNKSEIWVVSNAFIIKLDSTWKEKSRHKKPYNNGVSALSILKTKKFFSKNSLNHSTLYFDDNNLSYLNISKREIENQYALKSFTETSNTIEPVLKLSGIGYNSNDNFRPDFNKSIYTLGSSGMMYITFAYSNTVFEINIANSHQITSSFKLADLKESNYIDYSWSTDKKLTAIREMAVSQASITNIFTSVDFLILDILRVKVGDLPETIDLNNRSSVSNYMVRASALGEKYYRIYSKSDPSLGYKLTLPGELLEIENNTLYIKEINRLERDFEKIYLYEIGEN